MKQCQSNQKKLNQINNLELTDSIEVEKVFDLIKWNASGLIPAVVQSEDDRKILMLAWVNSQALKMSIETATATYYSRSRKKIWVKGETSGNTQTIKKINLDCDLDSVLFIVEQKNKTACHTNRESCFFYQLDDEKKIFNITLEVKNNK